MKGNDLRRLEGADNTMLRWMCDAILGDRIRTAELMDDLGVVFMEEVLS